MEVIYESADLSLLYVDRASDTVWVTFGTAHTPFAECFLAKRSLSGLFFVPRGEHWYQTPSVWPALNAARALLGEAGRIIHYGSSMGGFAALAFARDLGAHVVIAAAPQVSVHPAVVPQDRRWSDRPLNWQRPDAREGISGRVVLIYDPSFEPDAYNAEMIPADERLLVDGAGHHPLEPMRRARTLGDTVFALAARHLGP